MLTLEHVHSEKRTRQDEEGGGRRASGTRNYATDSEIFGSGAGEFIFAQLQKAAAV